MICINFFQQKEKICGCTLFGHAGFAEKGEDIVCASVSSAVQLTANMLTEVFHINADISVAENSISINLPLSSPLEGLKILEGLELHSKLLKEDYPNFIQIKHTEV